MVVTFSTDITNYSSKFHKDFTKIWKLVEPFVFVYSLTKDTTNPYC